MAGPDLNIDLARLDRLRNDLGAIVKEFQSDDEFSDTVAQATGQARLAGKVRDFAHAWNRKREDMRKNVQGLVTTLGVVTDNFTKVDTDLAKALRDGDEKTGGAGAAQVQPAHSPAMRAV